MKFIKAMEAIRDGYKVARPKWGGFWCRNPNNNNIEIHCKDGQVLLLTETTDLFYTLANICAEDWEIVTVEERIIGEAHIPFGRAIELCKEGYRIKREGWNGKDQYVELATNISYENSAGEIVNIDHQAIGNAALAFVGTSGIQLGWLASQADMLAGDWIAFNQTK